MLDYYKTWWIRLLQQNLELMKKIFGTILFSALFFFQSVYVIAFSFKEGFSSIALLAFCYFLIPTVILWIFFLLLVKYRIRYRVLMIIGILLMIILEILLPVSPIKTTYVSARKQRAIDRVIISNLNDTYYYSSQGNPIGIRITFEVLFSDRGEFSVSPTLYTSDTRYNHYILSMSHFANIEILPKPERTERGVNYYQKGKRYKFICDLLPGFIFEAQRDTKNLNKNELCLYELESQNISAEDFGRLINDPNGAYYNIEVIVSGVSYFVTKKVVATAVTSKSYSHKTFYHSALKEKTGKCKF
jgi:hypothetical protein